jgi:radical SAM protein (TIGR01212 family)
LENVDKFAKKRTMRYPLNKRYNSYLGYLKQHYGERIQKVTVDAGFTCPNRDGTLGKGGCIYCNNMSFNPGYNDASKSITQQIKEGIAFLTHRYRTNKYIVYFQPFSNTYAPLNILQKYYQEALSIPQVIGLTIGTRPDCIDDAKLAYLAELARDYDITIEYGLESISDATLSRINRGHDFQCFLDAVQLTAAYNVKICTHIILGFPWENQKLWLREANILSGLPINFLKIHHLHIVKDTPLGEEYQQNPFALLSFSYYLDVIITFLEQLNPDIIIQRLAGEAPPHMLLAPRWGMRSSEIVRRIEKEMGNRNTWQGRYYKRK